jgi:serine/threonine protein kinase
MIGRRVGNYQIIRSLGEGGMGAVYMAEHPKIGKQVAIKTLRTPSRQDVVDSDSGAPLRTMKRGALTSRPHSLVQAWKWGSTTDGSRQRPSCHSLEPVRGGHT